MDLKAYRDEQLEAISALEANIAWNKEFKVVHRQRRGMDTGWTDTTSAYMAELDRQLGVLRRALQITEESIARSGG